MINASHPVLNQAPESFHGVRVNIANYVDLRRVVNPLVAVTHVRHVRNSMIGVEFVGKDSALGKDVFFNHPEQSRTFDVIRNQSLDAALALNNSNHGSLNLVPCHRSACAALALAAHVGFIHLHTLAASAEPWGFLIVQHGANLLKHAPCGLVRYACLSLNLFSGDATTSGGHEVDGIEPSRKRSGRLVEDRSGSRVNVMAATVARVGRATSNAMVLGGRFALDAIDTFRVQAIAKPFKAGRIIWELFLEVFQGVRQHVRLAVIVGHLFTYSQVKSYQMAVPTVKG